MLFLQIKVGEYSLLQWIVLLIILVIACIQDIRSKYIHVNVFVLAIVFAIAFNASRPFVFRSLFFGLLPGLILIIISFTTKEAVGYGDGMMFLYIGSVLGIDRTALIFILSFFASSLVSLILLILKKAGRKEKIPFIPFILFGVCVSGFV